MRALFLAALAFGALAAFSTDPAEAGGFPYCIKGRDYINGTGDCRFPSYEACEAAASGIFAYCDRNPFYAWGSYTDTQPPRRKKRRAYIQQGY